MTPASLATATPEPRTAAAPTSVRDGRAEALGAGLIGHLADPDAFAAALRRAFDELADPAYRQGQRRVAPGIGPTHGVRTPRQSAIRRAFERGTRRASSSELLRVADRLLHEDEREAHWFAIQTLRRTLRSEAERSWQLLRRAAAGAGDWITVDALAHPYGQGILAEPYRWAELEPLTVSPSRWERRLVGSTIATMPFVDRRRGRDPHVAERALALLESLMGDREPDVQKSLAWAYRSMTLVDPAAVAAALRHQADLAAAGQDGHRAWVVRDGRTRLAPDVADELRTRVAGIRRRPGAPSTSDAAALAERFAGMGLGRPMPEPPLA